jgi:hypothetical protein
VKDKFLWSSPAPFVEGYSLIRKQVELVTRNLDFSKVFADDYGLLILLETQTHCQDTGIRGFFVNGAKNDVWASEHEKGVDHTVR